MTTTTKAGKGSLQGQREQADLVAIVLTGRAQTLVTLVRQGGVKNLDVNASLRTGPHAGLTPLHCAAARGDDAIVAAILSLGARTNVRTKDGVTPLHAAAEKGHAAAVRLLLEHGAAPGAASDTGDTPLNLAAVAGHAGAVDALVKAGGSVLSKGSSGDTAFHSACTHKDDVALRIVEALCGSPTSTSANAPQRAGAAPQPLIVDEDRPPSSGPQAVGVALASHNKAGATPLHLAAAKASVTVARRLLELGADANVKNPEDEEVPLHMAARGGHTEMVRLLLDQKGVDVGALNASGETALHLAMSMHSRAHTATGRLLLERGAVSAQRTRLGEGSLHVAAREGNVSLVRALLAKPGAHKELQIPGAHGRTPLHTAVAHGRKAMVALLLGQPECGRGAVDSRGMTAMHLAVVAGDVAMLGQLAGARAGPGASRTAEVGQLDEFCARNQLGWCALHTAAFRGQEVAVRLLLDAGAPIDWPTADGCTALHLAAAEGRLLTLQVLLGRGSNVHARAAGGETALAAAVLRGNSRAAELLLAAGADAQVPDHAGWTPMHSALWQGDRDMTRELLRHGGAVRMSHAEKDPHALLRPGGRLEEHACSAMPAGDPIDHASAELKRLLVKQDAASAAADEAQVRYY